MGKRSIPLLAIRWNRYSQQWLRRNLEEQRARWTRGLVAARSTTMSSCPGEKFKPETIPSIKPPRQPAVRVRHGSVAPKPDRSRCLVIKRQRQSDGSPERTAMTTATWRAKTTGWSTPCRGSFIDIAHIPRQRRSDCSWRWSWRVICRAE